MKHLLRIGIACIAIGAVAPGAHAGEPLRRMAGDLHAVAHTAEVGLGSVVGSFVLESAGEGDLRLTPGSLSITSSLGSITAVAEPLTPYAVRRIDPATGRPLDASETTGCTTGFETACLPIASNFSIGPEDPNAQDPARNAGSYAANPPLVGDRTFDEARLAANPLAFDAICATSVGRNPIDRRACALSIFNSSVDALLEVLLDPSSRKQAPNLRISALRSNILAGNRTAASVASANLAHTSIPLVPLNADPCDGFLSNGQGGCTAIPARSSELTFAAGGATLNQVLTDEQEALLGCGPFWGTDCETDGIDLLNVEASVLLQSFVGFEGLHDENGAVSQVAGSRGPEDPGYNPNVDGTVAFAGVKLGQCAGATRLSIPCGQDRAGSPPFLGGGYGAAAGQPFTSEMAALSFNMQNVLVAFSVPSFGAPVVASNELDAADPFSDTPNQCSFLQPQFCVAVTSLARWSSKLLPDDPSGAPSIRWAWEIGATFSITDATGELASFAGGMAHVIGPEVARFDGGDAGITIILEPLPAVMPPSNVLVREFGVGPDGIPDTGDDEGRPLGFAYGLATVPEATALASSLAAFAALASLKRRRTA